MDMTPIGHYKKSMYVVQCGNIHFWLVVGLLAACWWVFGCLLGLKISLGDQLAGSCLLGLKISRGLVLAAAARWV